MMRLQAAVLVVAAACGAAHATTCGPGTYLDKVGDTCLIGLAPDLRRAVTAQPAVTSKSGNVVIEVADGKQVGYKIGDADVVQLGDVIPNLKEFTEDTASSMVKSYADIMDLGFRLGKAQGGSNAVLTYIKDELTTKVVKLQGGLDKKADVSIIDTVNKNVKKVSDDIAAANKKAASEAATASKKTVDTVNAALKGLQDSVKALTARSLTIDTTCTPRGLSYNPSSGKCCENDYSVYDPKQKKCVLDKIKAMGRDKSVPATNCLKIKEVVSSPQNGIYWLKPGNCAAFQAYCRFDGKFPGATLGVRKPRTVSGMERITKERNAPCNWLKPGSNNYCKLSDAQINCLSKESPNADSFISLAFKGSSDTINCAGFVDKRCIWNSAGAGNGYCANAHKRGGRRCSRNQRTNSYRAIDGHHCNNGLNYVNEGGLGGNQQNNGRSFIIFEHSGGTHYCGGWQTTWDHVEMWIH